MPAVLRRSSTQVVMVAAGLAMIAAAALGYSGTDAYPGVRALLPVAGALLVVAGGERSTTERSNVLSGASS